MQLHEYRAKLSAIRSFAAPAQCPHCGDVMVAPVSSEFVEGGGDSPPLGMRGVRRAVQHLNSTHVSLTIFIGIDPGIECSFCVMRFSRS